MIELIQNKDRPENYRISGEMTIYDAVFLRNELISILTNNNELEIDLSDVTEVDTTGLQIMYALQKEAKILSKKIHWTNHSEAILNTINLLNLGSSLGETVSLEWS